MSGTQSLATRFTPDKLPHAILFTSRNNALAYETLQPYMQYLLCLVPNKKACGHCQSCRLFLAGSHPDICALPFLEKNKISIDDIRELIEFATVHPKISQRQIVTLCPAETMHVRAANGLLKILEEPPQNSYLFLFSEQPIALPITVRSRCMKWNLVDVAPKQNDALDAVLQDIMKAPEAICKIADIKSCSAIEVLNHLWLLVSELIKYQQANESSEVKTEMLESISQQWCLSKLWIVWQQINEQLNKLLQGYSIDMQLFLEQ